MYGIFTYTLRLQMATFKTNADEYFLHAASGNDWPKFGSLKRPTQTYAPLGKGETSIIYKPTKFLDVPAVYFLGRGPQQSRF